MTDEKIKRLLYRSRNSRKVVARSKNQLKAGADIKEISDYVTEIGKTGDDRLMLESELAVLQEERDHLSN